MPRTMDRAKKRAQKAPKKLAPILRARKRAHKAEEPIKFTVLSFMAGTPTIFHGIR